MSALQKWFVGILVVLTLGMSLFVIRIDTIFTPSYKLPPLSELIDPSVTYNATPIIRELYSIPNIEVSVCARGKSYSEELISAERIARGIIAEDGSLRGVAHGVLYTFSNPEKDKKYYLIVWGPDKEIGRWSLFLFNGPDSAHPAFAQLPNDLEDSEKFLLQPWIEYSNATTSSFPDGGRWTKVVVDVDCANEALNDQAWREHGEPRFIYGFSHLDRFNNGGGTWGTIQ